MGLELCGYVKTSAAAHTDSNKNRICTLKILRKMQHSMQFINRDLPEIPA